MKFLFIIILFFIFIGMLFGFSIFRFLFRGLNPTLNQQRSNKQTRNKQNKAQNQSKNQKKIIDSNEGEYVDYEEIKD
jgi:hypothetical protein